MYALHTVESIHTVYTHVYVYSTARHHTLYIWDKASGNLVKILSGQKGEMLLDVVVSKEGECAYFTEEFAVFLF